MKGMTVALIALAGVIGIAGPASAQAAGGYFTAPFSETTHTPTFGQAPVFVPHTDPQLVVFGHDYDKAGSLRSSPGIPRTAS
jgi:hypothetical protein